MTFSTKLLAATKDGAYATTDKSALAGLSDAQIAAAAQAAQSRKQEGYVLPLQNTTQQPDLGLAQRPRDARSHLREILEPCRARRCQRYARHHLAPGTAACAAGATARLSQPRGVEAGRPDGENSRGRLEVHGRPGARRDRQGSERGQGYSGCHRRAEGRLHSPALGLGLLLRTGAQGEVRSERGGGQAVLRAEQCARKRRLLRGQSALRDHLQGTQGHPGLPTGCSRLRGLGCGRQAAGALLLRLFQARQQERRRMDG